MPKSEIKILCVAGVICHQSKDARLSDFIFNMQEKINQHLEDGWNLQGGLSISFPDYANKHLPDVLITQTVIREKISSDPIE